MGTESIGDNNNERNTTEYLAQLLKDKKQIQALPNFFIHLERILDDEINRVRGSLFQFQSANRDTGCLPEPAGPVVQLSEKLWVPVDKFPEYNFVGRILGPRGMTAKQLEHDTGCKIMVRGSGSMRDKKQEEMNRGKPNWEHLKEPLHVLITVEDTENRAHAKIERAKAEVMKLLVPSPEGEDDLKKRQLMELAIINGTYRDTTKPSTSTVGPTIMATSQLPHMMAPTFQLRNQLGQAGTPIILAPQRMPTLQSQLGLQQHQLLTATGGSGNEMLSSPPGSLTQDPASGLFYSSAAYDQMALLQGATQLLTYAPTMEQSNVGATPKMRRIITGIRDHPYQRVSLS